MKVEELAAKGDIQLVLSTVKQLQLKSDGVQRLGYLSKDDFEKQTGLGTTTIWRLENAGVIRAYRFRGSNKKFYKITELEKALEKG